MNEYLKAGMLFTNFGRFGLLGAALVVMASLWLLVREYERG